MEVATFWQIGEKRVCTGGHESDGYPWLSLNRGKLEHKWNLLIQYSLGVWMGINRIANWGPYLLLYNEFELYLLTINE